MRNGRARGDAAAELGSLAGDDVSSVTLSAPGIEPITFDASTAPVHRAKARQLRELAAQ
jgi:hypothetical protein